MDETAKERLRAMIEELEQMDALNREETSVTHSVLIAAKADYEKASAKRESVRRALENLESLWADRYGEAYRTSQLPAVATSDQVSVPQKNSKFDGTY